MWFGRIIGLLLGAAMLGWFGALLGYLVGRLFDQGLAGIDARPPQRDHAKVQQVFLETVLRLMGHLAKSDGRITEAEIEQAEQLMAQLGLHDERRLQAITLFKEGSSPDFSFDDTMIRFQSVCGRYRRLRQPLLELLFHIAFADDVLHPAEREVLASVAAWLRIADGEFNHLLEMYRAQHGFAEGRSVQHGGRARLKDAYTALGVHSRASDREIRSAYRKLMSKHHPDKLMAQGVPEEMLRVATEKAQEISAAYDLIAKNRADPAGSGAT